MLAAAIGLNLNLNSQARHWQTRWIQAGTPTPILVVACRQTAFTMDIPRNVNGGMRLLGICKLLPAVASGPGKVSEHLHGGHGNANATDRLISALPLVLAPPLLCLLDG